MTAFADLIANVRAAQVPHFADPADEPALEKLEARLAEASTAANAILSQPARTMAALQAKAAALAWEIDGEPQDGFPMDGFRAAALRSFLADVAALQP
ncbi:hypothetical protein RSWS8N_04065 [Cereibacter sphaeroides WS8N]|uniref:hypothetical protein n=1 Tax=Cereibacter sphaeroides TaxID=1063 RepID=UPI00020DF6D1|nr:hypothetical protein [Cereibacter sphaeroides]EGJ21225.1 hypothetical protein RSWS8N_04065 [Cereibacter sphaeroides WS8N]